MAAMFFALMVAFVVKHVAGMRGSPQAASMLETEVTSWEEDLCAQFRAKKKSRGTCQCPTDRPFPRNCEGTAFHTFNLKTTIKEGSDCHCEEDPCEKFDAEVGYQYGTCQCPRDLPFPRNCEGRSGRTFYLFMTIKKGSNCHCEDPCDKFGAKRDVQNYNSDTCLCPKDHPRATKECGVRNDVFRASKASAGCRCLSEVEALERLSSIPVEASALRFCEALVEKSYGKTRHGRRATTRNMEDALSKTSPQICQHALTGTITPTEAEEAPWAENASELSRKGSDEDRNGDRRYGRMRPVKENAIEKALWKDALLARVCKDECDDLLNMMEKETKDLAYDVVDHHTPFAQACAEHVVQHVEAEILGCCGRSCGFDGRRCLLWPFFSAEEKVDWEVECCAEMSILKNSSRELMCNSVLPDRLAKEASQYDLNEQAGVDIGKVLLGQNSSLVWTKEGAEKSALGKEVQAHDGDKVSMDFLIKHQKIGEEYLRLGYFKEEPITKMLDESTSLMEVSSQDATCDFGKFEKKCPQKFMTRFVEKCNEKWNVAEDSADFRRFLTHPGGGHCTESDPQNFSTPEECQKLAKNSFGTVFLHYFEYDKDKDLPIKCFSVSVSNDLSNGIKKQCQGDDWWKRIKKKFMSVKKLMKDMNGRDVNDYAQLVYIKSMKTN